ncbi:SctK family type III secretion system sorting platform protein [Noviherbaspirillum sp.]|uniref:SctK family type III secretion system sorting platform protein n=1 Tax=Noviherbaspirillum sp. TaxID=1926288 RepID=UPI002B489080|nr:SctK family type III secretion system sorting platform protein [Noviherbaspirillum sp.]HJV80595.1 SctK family type III secretion system sorting platform protein [Noviherbaspirillum sp.]
MSIISLLQLGGRRAADFALRPSLSMDENWKRKILPPMFQANEVSMRAHRFVSRHIASQRALVAAPSDAGTDRLVWAIVLLEPCRLDAFLLHFGALFAAQEVRQVIGKKEVDAYKQVLGDALYWFMLHRAPLLGAAALAEPRRHGPDQIMAAIRGAGYAALSQLCGQHEAGLWDRVQLMLPDVAQAEASAYSTIPEAPTLRRMAAKLLRELETTWASRFLADNRSV